MQVAHLSLEVVPKLSAVGDTVNERENATITPLPVSNPEFEYAGTHLYNVVSLNGTAFRCGAYPESLTVSKNDTKHQHFSSKFKQARLADLTR